MRVTTGLIQDAAGTLQGHFGWSFAGAPFIRVGIHEIVVKESVQGLSHRGGIRTMVGMEASASNERLDFAFA